MPCSFYCKACWCGGPFRRLSRLVHVGDCCWTVVLESDLGWRMGVVKTWSGNRSFNLIGGALNSNRGGESCLATNFFPWEMILAAF
ncbi:unnamed protein product [Microthlaspi erraticum]|uniref:Uncharacterized protein n=1 Tax=Microthlaspi erraticum TaxID=1685480 RepID=A0A6D2HH53_9BRAS|nr:unnamed protein product [Microthlaspi erraticum]